MVDLPMVIVQALADRQDLLLALIDRSGKLVWINQGFAAYSKKSIVELIGQKFFQVLSLHSQCLTQETYIREQLIKGESFKFEFAYYHDDHVIKTWLLMDGQPIVDADGIIRQYSLLATDITLRKQAEIDIKEAKSLLEKVNQELEVRVEQRTCALIQQKEQAEEAFKQLQQIQMQMSQTEKMSALGNLVAGVAHEINNPVGFLAGNLQPAQNYIQDLLNLVDLYQQKYPNPDAEIEAEIDIIDLENLREDFPKLIRSMQQGVSRLSDISASLRIFSRADIDRPISFNIHEGLDSTLLILQHRLKASSKHPEIKVIKDYANLPLVECYAGQINQVFMNLLANAIDALEEAQHRCSYEDIKAQMQQITIRTRLAEDEERVLIHIVDNGPGMTADIKARIFDQLFTTKAVNKGTGLGLAIARQIIVEKHAGNLYCYSHPGEGAEFIIELPVKQRLNKTTTQTHKSNEDLTSTCT